MNDVDPYLSGSALARRLNMPTRALFTLLAEHGTPAQRRDYLTPMLQARRRPAHAITEAEAGSDVAALATTAETSSPT